jgi:hypothetical protein
VFAVGDGALGCWKALRDVFADTKEQRCWWHKIAAKWPEAVAKITNDLDVLLAFYDFPGEDWIHLCTTNPIESTFATVRLRQRVTRGPGSRAAGRDGVQTHRVGTAPLACRQFRPPRRAGQSRREVRERRAAIPLIVIGQCAVARRVVAP